MPLVDSLLILLYEASRIRRRIPSSFFSSSYRTTGKEKLVYSKFMCNWRLKDEHGNQAPLHDGPLYESCGKGCSLRRRLMVDKLEEKKHGGNFTCRCRMEGGKGIHKGKSVGKSVGKSKGHGKGHGKGKDKRVIKFKLRFRFVFVVDLPSL